MKDLSTLKPREVEAYLRKVILETFGDAIENRAQVSASHGYYDITIDRPNDYSVSYLNVRKKQLPQIVKALRGLK